MFPYTLISFLLLAAWCLLFPYKGEKSITVHMEENASMKQCKKQLVIYGMLFALCVLTVAHVIPYLVSLGIVLIVVLILDKNVLREVDYALLLTFIGFFVFIGNMGRIPAFNALIQNIIDGNEVVTSVVASQFMSNVPAALLLSGFTNQFERLIVGTNLGGLGTLIASMASLISFKYIGKEYGQLKGKYMVYFTIANILFFNPAFWIYFYIE